MSPSKKFASDVVATASKKDRLFGLSREELKFVRGATGVIISNPLEQPVTTPEPLPGTVVPPVPAADPLAPLP